MNHWKILPASEIVAQFIECYWLIEKTAHDTSIDFPKLNPDPSAHIILTESEQCYRREEKGKEYTVKGDHLLLPNTQTYILDHQKPFLLVGIKLRVGAPYTLQLPMAEPLLNQVIEIDLASLFSQQDFNSKTLFNLPADNSEQYRDVLDRLLIPWLSHNVVDKQATLVRKALGFMAKLPLASIGDAAGCSQRTIERAFLKVTGLTLKQYYSMTKLEQLLAYLHKLEQHQINWAEVALKFDFSDQPHLVRYLKSVLGNTPGQYVKRRDLTIDAYGNFDS